MTLKQRIIKRLITIFLITLLLISASLITFIIYFGTSHRMEYKKTSKIYYLEYTYEPIELTENEIINKVNKLFNQTNYRLSRYKFKGQILGDSSVFTREIRIKENLPNEDFTFTLVHELVHINYVTRSERFCEFQAFKLLYESNDEYLVYVANLYAKDVLNKRTLMSEEYDCSGYIEIYLKERGII